MAPGCRFTGRRDCKRLAAYPCQNRCSRKETERQGTHTSGIVVRDQEGRRIALYRSGRQHAGEKLDDLLKNRNPALGAPMKMSDAAALNGKKKSPTVDLNCLAHGRGKFKEIEENFPLECVIRKDSNIIKPKAGL